jgi:hypothetical protein
VGRKREFLHKEIAGAGFVWYTTGSRRSRDDSVPKGFKLEMQRFVPHLLFALVVFVVGFLLGMQVSPLQAAVAWSFGGGAVLPVLVATLAAHRPG